MATTVFAVTASRDDAPVQAGLPRLQRSGLSAEVLSGVSGFAGLRQDWERLAAINHHGSCFQAPDMLGLWARHFAKRPDKLKTVVVRQGSRAVLIWPLAVSRKNPVRIVSGAGAPITQYDDMLLDPDCNRRDALSTAMACIAAEIRPDIMAFSNLRAGGPVTEALGPAATAGCEPEGAPFTDLSGGLDGVRSAMKTRARQNQRKRMQKFREAGAEEFRIAETPAEAEAWLGEILTAKRKWLTATGRYSRAFNDPRTAACLRDMARSLVAPAPKSSRIVIAKLSLDGVMAAMEFAFVHNGTYYLYIGAFSEELGHFGPGNVLTEKAMEWCVANGITRYDMMAPRTRNKGEWQTGEVEVTDRILPLTKLGEFYTATVLRKLGPAVRDSFYRLPDGWRSAIAGRSLRI